MNRTALRVCKDCGLEKSGEDFNWRIVNGKGPYAMSYCKACYRVRYSTPAELEKGRARVARLRAGDPNVALRDRVRKYGITAQQYNEMVDAQGGVCAICKQPDSTGTALHVDHCHELNVVRGLLCGRCNRGLGMFKDDPARLSSAVTYLLTWGGK